MELTEEPMMSNGKKHQDMRALHDVLRAHLHTRATIDWDYDETAHRYGLLCDVVERMWQHWPLEDDTGMLHTSDDARAAANRILEILGVMHEPISIAVPTPAPNMLTEEPMG